MKKYYVLLASFLMTFSIWAQNPGDEIVVQTFEYEGFPVGEGWLAPREGFFDFTAVEGLEFEKVLIYYNLKCDPNQNPACGEWDYISAAKVMEYTGRGEDPSYLLGGKDGLSPSTYQFMDNVSFNYTPRFEETITYTDPNALSSYTLGNGATTIAHPLDATLEDASSHYLFRASELTAAGLTAGDITGLQLNVASLGDEVQNLKIKLKSTTETTLNDLPDTTGFTEVYAKNTTVDATGWVPFDFTTFFDWDVTSNVLVEISFTGLHGTNAATIAGDNLAWDCASLATSRDTYLEFNGPDVIEIPVDNLGTISNEVTISFWANGGVEQPQPNSVFEALSEDGRRVMNVHLPWSNGRVYWDAGGETGYDRIEKDADDASQYEGTWNHWAFTKNATTGVMNIYLNGTLWHTGSNLTRPIDPSAIFAIGNLVADATNDRFYDGKLDDFAIWDTELDEATIAAWMTKEIDATHPQYANLVAYYPFNGINELEVTDAITNQTVALRGIPQRKNFNGNRFKNFSTSTQRPQVQFNRNTSAFTVTSELVEDISPKGKIQIEMYEQLVADEKPELVETLYKYPTYYNNYIYDENGVATDSTFVTPDQTINLELIEYATTDPEDEIVVPWELGRFITPYGNGLDLGEDGWTWIFDITDFQHLLQGDNVHMLAGNFQELLDLKVVFTVGTPPRDFISIDNIYSGNYSLNTFDEQVVETTIPLHPDAENFALKTAVSGHGFGSGANCGEFCNNIHSVKVNGTEQYAWQIMQECGENPLYPQGGTWMYDRAGWCPGAPVTTQNLEMTPFVNVGNDTSINVDYDIEHDPDGNYVTEIFFVNYGAPNFANDVALEEIIAPNIFKLNTRFNPICGQPIIRIKNTGSASLTSATITYGVSGEEPYTFDWTGDLGFLDEAVVVLPSMEISDFYAGPTSFEASVGNPNGTGDEYEFNNSKTSTFETAPVYDQQLIVEFRTNSRPFENSYKVFDTNGTEVFERSGFTANTTHTDVLNLPPGCYDFVAYDSGGDGMNNWPSNHGNGFIRLKTADGTTVANLERWFGESIKYAFRNDAVLSVDEQTTPVVFSLHPNPALDTFNITLHNLETEYSIQIVNITGATVFEKTVSNGSNTSIDVSAFSSGVYMVQLESNGVKQVKKLIVE